MKGFLLRLRLLLSAAARRIGSVLRTHGFVLPIYLGITLLYTYPMVLHFSDAIIGTGPDALQSYWTMWWTRWALFELGQNSFQGTLMHHPFGLTLYFHVHNFLNSLLSLPLQLCCGTAAAYNTMVVLTFVGTGVSIYALTWDLVRQRVAAFLAGIIGAFNPYMVMHLSVGQPYLLAIGWLALYILALRKALHAQRYWIVLAALCLLFVALTDWHYAIFAVLLTGLIGLYEALRLRSWHALSTIGSKLVAVGMLFALILSPILVPMLVELTQRPSVPRPLWNAVYHSTDLVAYLLPSIYHPLWGEWARDIFYGRLVTWYIVGGIATLGYVPLLLALVGCIVYRQHSRLFVLLFLVFFVLTLGPFLQVNGWNSYRAGSPIPLPYLLLRELPLMNIQRVPSRFFVVVLLALAVLAGLGVAWLAQQAWLARLSLWRRIALLGGLTLLVLFEYWPQPFPITAVGPEQVPPFYLQLATREPTSGVLEIPYRVNTSSFYQTYHRHPTVGGVISRTPPHPWQEGRFFDGLLNVDADLDDVGIDDSPAAVRAALRCNNIRYVVFYQDDLGQRDNAPDQRKIEQMLFAHDEPIYADDTLRAYELSSDLPPEPYWTLAPGQWYDQDRNEQGIAYRWAADEKGQAGELLIYPCGRAQQQAVVEFNLFSFAEPRTLQMSFHDQPAGGIILPESEVRRVQMLVSLDEEVNRLHLRSAEPAVLPNRAGFTNDERLVSFNISQVMVRATRD